MKLDVFQYASHLFGNTHSLYLLFCLCDITGYKYVDNR
jgi:hypothetical protein